MSALFDLTRQERPLSTEVPWHSPINWRRELQGVGVGGRDAISAHRAVWQSLLMGWQEVAASDEVEAADWIHGRLHPFAQDVGSVVPTGFGAYARIFHPARGPHPPKVEVRWSEVAAWSGKTVHPEMQFHSIAIAALDRSHTPTTPIHPPRIGVLSLMDKPQHSSGYSRSTRVPRTPAGCAFGRAMATSIPGQRCRPQPARGGRAQNRLGLSSDDSALTCRRQRLGAFLSANG